MYANMYINVYSGHTGCGNRFMGKVHSWPNFYFDGHVRYRKSKEVMMTALKMELEETDIPRTCAPSPSDSGIFGFTQNVTNFRSQLGAPQGLLYCALSG